MHKKEAMSSLIHHLKSEGRSAGDAKRLLNGGKVYVHGVPTSDGGQNIDPKDVKIILNAPKIVPGRDLFILHKDKHVAVVCKPAGMLSVPAGKAGGHKNVLGLSRALLGAAYPVHRLDEQTSGLMLIARTISAQNHLKAQLEKHSVERRYFALVQGKPKQSEWSVENRLVRNRGDGLRGSRPKGWDDPGKDAKTHFRNLGDIGRGCFLIEAQLETGRTHQVRIHLSEDRLPILGDPLYSPFRVARVAERLCLHAYVIGYKCPESNKTKRFEIPMADDMARLQRHMDTVIESRFSPKKKGPFKGRKNKKKKR